MYIYIYIYIYVNARQPTLCMRHWHSAIAVDIGMRWLQRVCFTSSPSRSVMRAAAAALQYDHNLALISPLAHPV